MKFYFLVFSFCLLAIGGKSQAVSSFVPAGWKIFEEAHGDLNKDSIADVAIIIENTRPPAYEDEMTRRLLILFKNKSNQFSLACTAPNVILGKEEGGSLGDPFQSMEIKNNVLRIDFSGGSSDEWTTTHRYRFQNNFFYVIGATFKASYNGETTTYDYNLNNGKMIITTKNSQNSTKNKTVNKSYKIVQPGLQDFEPKAIWAIFMPKDYSKTVQCTLDDAGVGDCAHIIFSCGDFGNASLYMDEAGAKLWSDLVVTDKEDNAVVNPKYKGKKFEITYATEYGVRCESQGFDKYQLVTGIKLLN